MNLMAIIDKIRLNSKTKLNFITKQEKKYARIPGCFSFLLLIPIFYAKTYRKILWLLTTIFSVMCDLIYTGEDSIWLLIDRCWAIFISSYLAIRVIDLKNIKVACMSMITCMFYGLSMLSIKNRNIIGFIISHSIWHIVAPIMIVIIEKNE